MKLCANGTGNAMQFLQMIFYFIFVNDIKFGLSGTQYHIINEKKNFRASLMVKF